MCLKEPVMTQDHEKTPAYKVAPGFKVRHLSAEGNSELRVLRRHRDYGYWECVWLDGPRERGIWVRSENDILVDAYAS